MPQQPNQRLDLDLDSVGVAVEWAHVPVQKRRKHLRARATQRSFAASTPRAGGDATTEDLLPLQASSEQPCLKCPQTRFELWNG
jgi:hypothetical protein